MSYSKVYRHLCCQVWNIEENIQWPQKILCCGLTLTWLIHSCSTWKHWEWLRPSYLRRNTSLWTDALLVTFQQELWLGRHFSVSDTGGLVCFSAPWLVLEYLCVVLSEDRVRLCFIRCCGCGWLKTADQMSTWLNHQGKGYVGKNTTNSLQIASVLCCCLVAKLCSTLCDLMDCSTPDFPVLHYLPEFAQTHVHQVGDAIQLSHPLSSPSPSVFNLSQHQGLFHWVSSLHQVVKVLELQF